MRIDDARGIAPHNTGGVAKILALAPTKHFVPIDLSRSSFGQERYIRLIPPGMGGSDGRTETE